MIHTEVPELAIACVRSAGGPYDEGDILSLAFATPAVCRIVRHGEPLVASQRASAPYAPDPLVPDTISASIVVAAGPYAAGDTVTLSFVDPRIARIHSSALSTAHTSERHHETSTPSDAHSAADSYPAADVDTENTLDDNPVAGLPPNADTEAYVAARTRLSWPSDRALRFVHVCDRLFTVERLGWYRHALVMRLLLPDQIVCGDAAIDSKLAADLRILNASALETLGRPMLAAFMPNFSVTSEWLDSLDNTAAARALSHLCSTLTTRASDRPFPSSPNADMTWTEGSIALHEIESAPSTSAEALLPLLIANVSPHTAVTEKLTAYRDALIELFGQTAGSAEVVRLSQMALPNHILDDRLWQLVGVVSATFVAERDLAV